LFKYTQKSLMEIDMNLNFFNNTKPLFFFCCYLCGFCFLLYLHKKTKLFAGWNFNETKINLLSSQAWVKIKTSYLKRSREWIWCLYYPDTRIAQKSKSLESKRSPIIRRMLGAYSWTFTECSQHVQNSFWTSKNVHGSSMNFPGLLRNFTESSILVSVVFLMVISPFS
jgi:hypothetical protein